MEQRKLPNATAVLVLGILSIITCCCFGIFGIIFGVIALVLANKDLKLYRENPELYTNYSNLNTGKIIAIIGLCLSVIVFLKCLYDFIVLGPEGFQQAMEEFSKAYEQGKRSQQK